MSHISHDLSNVGSADDIYAEDGGMNDFDMSQEHSISDISDLPVYYNPRPSIEDTDVIEQECVKQILTEPTTDRRGYVTFSDNIIFQCS